MKKIKKIFSTIIMVVGLFGILLGSMIVSDNYKKNNAIDSDSGDFIADATCNIYAVGYANTYKYDNPEGPICGTQVNVNYSFNSCFLKEGQYYRKYNAKKGSNCKGTSSETSSSSKTLSVSIGLIGESDSKTVGSVTIYSSNKQVGLATVVGTRANYTCTSGNSCSANVSANPASGYTFVKWSSSTDCSNSLNKQNPAYFSASEFRNITACFTKNSTTGGNTGGNTGNGSSSSVTGCKIYVEKRTDSNEIWQIWDGGYNKKTSSSSLTTPYVCQSDNCYITFTDLDTTRTFNGIAGDGNCTTGGRGDTKNSNKLFCTGNNNTITAKVCYYDEYKGGNTGGSSGGNAPVEEPPVVSNNEEVNSVYYAKGEGFSGSSIACGDKLYVTTCTKTNDPICNVSSINDKAVSNTQIRKSNIVKNQNETGCFQKIERYIAEKTYYYSDKGLSKDKTEIGCGSIVTFKKEIKSSCDGKSCEVEYNGKTVYVNIDYITSDKPACQNQDETKTCETSKKVTNAKGDVTVSICKNDDTEDTRNKIVSCAEDYEFKYKLTNDTCKDSNSDNCYKDYLYTCSYIKRPGVNASAGVVGSNGKGIITVTGVPYGNIEILGYHVSSGDEPTVNSGWSTFNAINNSFSIERSAGTYFIWAINNKRRISYPVLAKVYDADLSTTLASFKVQDGNGNDINTNISSLDGTVGYKIGVKDSKYALLSNSLIADSVGGFDKLTTSYELSVNSNKIALYATLTSSDASYVSGYEPRTIDLDYGRNVALIKIVNKDGKERCYTFIINRVDDRNNSNLLKNVKLSRGSIDFDPYTTNYDVKISRFTKKVSVNAELDSSTSTFIKGYEPREVEITEDRQSVILKVISEAGSIRSYVITFIRNGEDKDNINSTYLSSLTVPGTMLGFDKETYDYTITVPYETEDLPIYAFAEDENVTVKVGNNTGLKVGNNLIQIEVKNNNKTRIYSLHVIRKESGLDISNSARLGTLSIKNYNIEFSPDKLDYEVKIKREKTLLISATPESNRADIYMYGNNDLTGFSTIRVKVIAENGLTNIYSIDIQKAAYNKKIEIIASVAGVSALLIVSLVIYLKKKNNKRKEYLEG